MTVLNKNKNKIAIISLLLIAIVAVGITLALMKNGSNKVTNTFDVGSVETIIEEEDPKPDGDGIKKEPRIENTGKSSALVRAKVTITPQELVDNLGIKIVYNTEDWVYGGDGYYYYKNVLPKDGKTGPIFTKVTGKDIVENGEFSDKLNGLEIAVYHESVQSVIGTLQATSGDPTNPTEDNAAKQIWEIYDTLDETQKGDQ